jgi:hypothetical protein
VSMRWLNLGRNQQGTSEGCECAHPCSRWLCAVGWLGRCTVLELGVFWYWRSRRGCDQSYGKVHVQARGVAARSSTQHLADMDPQIASLRPLKNASG